MKEPPLILIVDDNPANVEILQMRLSANQYDIITASDGKAGLDMVRSRQPDLILLDVMMPKMDGFEVCRRIKGDPSLPFIPIILVTAKTESKDVVAGLEAGGDEYLTKPVDHAALVARVKSMLRIKSLHDTVLEQSVQLKKQLKTATKIQSLFWPKIPNLEPDGYIWAFSVPAAYVGGDLYDVIPLSDGSLLAYVADISDKGVPAALIMSALSTIIRSASRSIQEIDKLLSSINTSLYNLISEEGFFATIFMVRYWPTSGKMQLVSGGHLQPLWILQDGIGDLPELDGVSLGVTSHVIFKKREITLSPGESMLLFTDGLVEAENKAKELFGHQRLFNFVKDKKGKHLGQALLDEIGKWRGNADVNDDLTMLEIWREEG